MQSGAYEVGEAKMKEKKQEDSLTTTIVRKRLREKDKLAKDVKKRWEAHHATFEKNLRPILWKGRGDESMQLPFLHQLPCLRVPTTQTHGQN